LGHAVVNVLLLLLLWGTLWSVFFFFFGARCGQSLYVGVTDTESVEQNILKHIVDVLEQIESMTYSSRLGVLERLM
jgi:hypothetical protein